MLSIEQIRNGLKDHTLTKVADSTNISYRALYHLMNGGGKNPSQEVIEKLSEYLKEK